MKNILIFLRDIIKSRKLIWQMTKRDFKADFLGSYFGLAWAFIQPLVIISLLYFIMTFGLKAGATATGYPYILYLMAGYIPFFFLSAGLSNGTNSIVAYSYLVKKVVFRVSTLPIIKLNSQLIVHLFLVIFMLIIFTVNGYGPSIYWLEVIYLIFCTYIILLGITWITASLNVFAKDIIQIVNVCLQILFWGTPLFWQYSLVEHSHHRIALLLKLNPFFYIVQCYRDALVSHIPFWHHLGWTIYFWMLTIIILGIGAFVFRKLKPHFADVL